MVASAVFHRLASQPGSAQDVMKSVQSIASYCGKDNWLTELTQYKRSKLKANHEIILRLA